MIQRSEYEEDIIEQISLLKKEGVTIQNANPATATELFLKALAISREAGLDMQTAELLTDLAVCQTTLSNYGASIELLTEAQEICTAHNFSELLTKIRNNLGVNYYYLGNFKQACAIFEAILAEQLSRGDIHATRIVLVNLTNIYQHLGDFSKALECSFTSLEISREIGDEHRIGLNYGNLGMIYIELGEWDKAEDFLLKSLDIRRKRKDIGGEARILNNLGKVCQYKGKMSQAFDYAQMSIELREQIGDRSGIAKTLLSLGELYQSLGNRAMAMESLGRAIELATECEDIYSQTIALKTIGRIHHEAAEYPEAIQYYRETIEKSLVTGDKNIQMEVAGWLAECLAAMERWEEAYEQHRIFKKMEDEIKNTEKQAAIAEMQSFYEADTARRESEILKQVNNELAELNKKLEELTREKDNIIGIVAHELKNPLQGLHLMASLLERYSDKLSTEEIRINASKCLKTTDHMSGIIKNLLDIHALETGKIDVAWRSADPAEIIQAVIHDYYPQIAKKKIHVHFKKSEDRILINTDILLLRQIFENILSNAVKFSPSGKQVFVGLTAEDGFITCSVRDQGPGLTEEDLGKVFGKFTKLSARPTGGETSTGLGLSIVKKLTEALHGNVYCTSTVGEGAIFTVQFPAG